MALLLAQALPDVPASDVMARIVQIREKAWPNLRILTFGEEQLGRKGELSSAAGALYRLQLERRPEIKNFFVDAGRGREIDIALNGA
jgi:hypothetical protein